MFRSLICAFVFLIAATFGAAANEWNVLRVSGNVVLSEDGRTWERIVPGMEIPNAAWVRTGGNGRIILSRANERIAYGPDALAAISFSEPRARQTRVTHQKGSLLFDLDTGRGNQTTVATPHLAAVVKGTVFEVSVGGASSSVSVEEGVVGVSAAGRSVDVKAGQIASSAGRGIEVAQQAMSGLNRPAGASSGVLGNLRASFGTEGGVGGRMSGNNDGVGDSVGGGRDANRGDTDDNNSGNGDRDRGDRDGGARGNNDNSQNDN